MPRMSQVLEMVNQIVETDRMGLEEPLPPLKPITTQADIGCDQRSVREGLKRRNFRAAGERNCGSSGWSKSCGQGQAFLSVQT
ncbi:hypothetical protein Tco_1359175, partial [Tanacetum coccineum]